jgi:hypothetical protein
LYHREKAGVPACGITDRHGDDRQSAICMDSVCRADSGSEGLAAVRGPGCFYSLHSSTDVRSATDRVLLLLPRSLSRRSVMTDKNRLQEIEKALLTMSQTFRQIEANLPTTLQNLASN